MENEAAATKRCPACAEEIQAAAVVCRYCGTDLAPKKPAVRSGIAALGCGFVLLGVVAFGAYVVDSCNKATAKTEKQDPKNDEEITAWVMAQQFVKRDLKSPGSADFGSVFKGDYQNPKDHVRDLGSGRWEARGWVDSQNGFGALTRTRFTLTMQRDTGGTWTVTEGPAFEK